VFGFSVDVILDMKVNITVPQYLVSPKMKVNNLADRSLAQISRSPAHLKHALNA